nr:MAG TPA: Integrase [Caudoviricetes sp.]
MRQNFTDKMLKSLVKTTIKKRSILTDVTGLTLELYPSARGETNIKFMFRNMVNGKRIYVQFGSYPTTSLNDARKKYLETKEKIDNGLDPLEDQKKKKALTVTFGEIYTKWYELNRQTIKIKTRKKKELAYKNHLCKLADMPISSISAEFCINFYSDYTKKGTVSTGDYLITTIKAVLDYAVFIKVIEYNPIVNIKRYLPKYKPTHYNSFRQETLESDMIQLFNDMAHTTKIVQCLLYMYFFTLLRSEELRTLKYEYIHDDFALVKTKTWAEFKVPLCTQALRVIAYLKRHNIYNSDYVFTTKFNCISSSTLLKALNENGYKDKLRVHGIRTCGRQWLQTLSTAKETIIELCLSHVQGNAVQQAYNRGTYYEERKRIMQQWCNFVEKCIGHNFDFINE